MTSTGFTLGLAWMQAYAAPGAGIFVTYRALAFVFTMGVLFSSIWGVVIGGRGRKDD